MLKVLLNIYLYQIYQKDMEILKMVKKKKNIFIILFIQGVNDIKKHRWFNGIDLNILLKK